MTRGPLFYHHLFSYYYQCLTSNLERTGKNRTEEFKHRSHCNCFWGLSCFMSLSNSIPQACMSPDFPVAPYTAVTVHTGYQCDRRHFLLDFQNPKKADIVVLLLWQGYCNYSQCYFIMLCLVSMDFQPLFQNCSGPPSHRGLFFCTPVLCVSPLISCWLAAPYQQVCFI